MALATIVAGLALFVALMALWLTSDMMKKVENQNEKFVRAHIKSLRDEIRELDTSLGKVTRSVRALEEVRGGVDKRINEHTLAIDDLRPRIAKVAEDLEVLDRSIPPRYRARVVPAKEEGPVVKAKTTVQ